MLRGFSRPSPSLSVAHGCYKKPMAPPQTPPKKSKTIPSCNCHIEFTKLEKKISNLQKQLLETQAAFRNAVKEGTKKFNEGAQLVFDHWQQSLSKEVGVELRLAGLTDTQLALVRQSTTMYYDSNIDSPRWKRRQIEEWKSNEFPPILIITEINCFPQIPYIPLSHASK